MDGEKCVLCRELLGDIVMQYHYKDGFAHWHCIMNENQKKDAISSTPKAREE